MAEKNFLKICINEWENASRDKRELAACRELGMNVTVMAKGSIAGTWDCVSGFDVYRLSTRPWKYTPSGLNRLISVFTWAYHARCFHADIISGHDLIALTIGYLSNCFLPKNKKAKLVYDSHEFELGRNTKRSNLVRLGIKWLEGFLMRRSEFSIMVNDTIADEVQRIHRLAQRPMVVRSTPMYWERDEDAVMDARRELCAAQGWPQDAFIIMYHGNVVPGRSLENWVCVLATIPNVYGILLGSGDPGYVDTLCSLSKELHIDQRILFHEAVPHENLFKYVAAADIETCIGRPTCPSYYMSLPNKFFESIQAETPQIASDFPEQKRIICQYRIGLCVDSNNNNAIVEAIKYLRTNKEFYRICKENLKTAKQDLCWEREQERLKAAYRKLL